MKRSIIKIGETFGKLTIIRQVHRAGVKNRLVECSCSCGKITEVRYPNLVSGNTTSCGCHRDLVFEQQRSKKPKPELANKTRTYHSYKSSAKSRGYSFDLTKEGVNNLCSKPCHYCGQEPKIYSSARADEVWKRNGIDRVDNSIGYTLKNVVPCCKECNVAKHAQTLEVFLNWVERVHKHQNSNSNK